MYDGCPSSIETVFVETTAGFVVVKTRLTVALEIQLLLVKIMLPAFIMPCITLLAYVIVYPYVFVSLAPLPLNFTVMMSLSSSFSNVYLYFRLSNCTPANESYVPVPDKYLFAIKPLKVIEYLSQLIVSSYGSPSSFAANSVLLCAIFQSAKWPT